MKHKGILKISDTSKINVLIYLRHIQEMIETLLKRVF